SPRSTPFPYTTLFRSRLPIGTPDIIRNANPARLKQFYADWYRPDLMAVVVVGDFDKAAMEERIKAHFGSIPTTLSPKPRPVYSEIGRASCRERVTTRA